MSAPQVPKQNKPKRRRKARIRKDVRKDVEKMANHGRRKLVPNRGGQMGSNDPVADYMATSQKNAREAALATLDPISAVERGYLPGVCDGSANNTYRWSSKTSLTREDTSGGASDSFTMLAISPGMVNTIRYATGFTGLGVPTASAFVNDSSYAQAAATVSAVRLVAAVLELRNLQPPLDLNGDRVIASGTINLYLGGFNEVRARKDVFTIGNNKPGEVTRYPYLAAEQHDFHGVSADLSSADTLMNIIFAASSTGPSVSRWEITLTCIWEGLPVQSALITPTPFIGDPAIYAAALNAALMKCPLNSHERVTYEDDGGIASVASDVKNIIGQGKTFLSSARTAISSGMSVASSIGSLFGGLFGADAPEDEQHRVAAAMIMVAYQRGVLQQLIEILQSPLTQAQVAQEVNTIIPAHMPDTGFSKIHEHKESGPKARRTRFRPPALGIGRKSVARLNGPDSAPMSEWDEVAPSSPVPSQSSRLRR